MSPAEAEFVDQLFNAAWRGGIAVVRRLGPGVADGRYWAALRRADGSEFVAGVDSAGALDRLRTRPPYYVRFPGQDPEPVLGFDQAAAFFVEGTTGRPVDSRGGAR